MASNIKLTNTHGKTIAIVGDDSITQDITYNLSKNMYTVDTVADLRGMISVPEYVYASGYHTKNDGAFGSHFYRLATDTGQVDNGGTIIRTVNGVYELQYDGAVNVKWFGAVYDNFNNITMGGAGDKYYVTALELTGKAKYVYFNGAMLLGMSSTAQNHILDLRNFSKSNIYDVVLGSDGIPVYGTNNHLNYKCALRITSPAGDDASQYINIDTIEISYIADGIVLGNFYDEAAQANTPQSEITIDKYTSNGVLRPLTQNALNGNLQTTNSKIVGNINSAGTWFSDNYALGYTAYNKEGGWVSVNDEFVRIIAGGLGKHIKGSRYSISYPIWESNCPISIEPQVESQGTLADVVLENFAGSFANLTQSFIEVSIGSTGRLMLNDVELIRTSGGGTNGAIYIDSINAPDYRIKMINSEPREWTYNLNSSSALFIRGGKAVYKDSRCRNISGDFILDMENNVIDNIDIDGGGMSTTLDTTSKGGWTSVSGATFQKYTADLPTGYLSAIRLVTTGTGFLQSPTTTSGVKVTAGKTYTISMMLKKLGVFNNLGFSIEWYSFSGVSLGTQVLFNHDSARMTDNGFDKWQEMRCLTKAPAGSMYCRFTFTSSGATDSSRVNNGKLDDKYSDSIKWSCRNLCCT
jgi:hypothetical protein